MAVPLDEDPSEATEVERLGAAHAALSSRYQTLVLLNRLSLELFSEEPFAQRLSAGCSVILALTEAKSVSIHFTDDRGKAFCARVHGDKKLASRESLAGRDRAVARALETRALCASEGAGPGWVAAPLTRTASALKDLDGAVAIGFPGAPPPDPGRERLLGEIGAVLRRVRAVERDLERRQELDRVKSELVALVSHELRTPLSAIQGFTELALDCDDAELGPEKRVEHLKIVLDETKRLLRLVGDYLDLSKIEEGGAPPRRRPLDLAELAGRLRALFHDHPSKATLAVDIAQNAREIWGDADQLYRAFVNLCANALKYSPPGGVVSVAARRVLPGTVEISVEDQGPGVPQSLRARLFQRFARGDDKVARRLPGAGLGLAITKAIVEAHGGAIALDPKPGAGARFYFTLRDRGS